MNTFESTSNGSGRYALVGIVIVTRNRPIVTRNMTKSKVHSKSQSKQMWPQRRVRLEEDDERLNPETMKRKHAGGAVLKYNAKLFPRQAKLLAARGATQDEIAYILGVSTRTLQHWLARYPALSEAIQAGNDVFNPRLERALAESAIGYWVTWDEEILDYKTKKVKEVVRHKKFIPPSVQAQQFWMKNRMKDKWSDVHKHEVKPQYKSSTELIEDMRTQIPDLRAEGYLEGVVVPTIRIRFNVVVGKSNVNLVCRNESGAK